MTRADTIKEMAAMVAKSKETKVSDAYAIARELWTIWWREQCPKCV